MAGAGGRRGRARSARGGWGGLSVPKSPKGMADGRSRFRLPVPAPELTLDQRFGGGARVTTTS
jgi:hypothetical protein